MRALILAAGKSTRLGERAGGLPKPLVPVAGTPPLIRAIRWLHAAGIDDLWINLHHEASRISAAIGDGSAWGVRVRYSRESELLGTAGAWKRLRDEWTSTSLVVYGDNVMRFQLDAFIAAHRAGGRSLTMAAYDPAITLNSGIAGGWVVADAAGAAASFVEGQAVPGGLVNAGAYLLEPDVLEAVGDGYQDFGRDVLPDLARAGRVQVHVLERGSYCFGVDTPERLDGVERIMLSSEMAT